MPIDPSIPLSVEKVRINTPFENLAVVMEARQRENQARAQELALNRAQRQMSEEDQLRAVWQQYGDNPEEALKQTRKINPELAFKMEGDLRQAAIQNLTLQSKQREEQEAQIDTHLNRLLSVKKGDTVMWDFVRGEALKADPGLDAELPKTLETDEDVAQLQFSAMRGKTARERIRQEREYFDKLADNARLEAKDKATAAAAARTATRLAARDTESERHNRAMEAIGRARANRPASSGNSTDAADAEAIADAITRGEQPPELTGLYRMGAPVRAALARKGYNQTEALTDWRATQKHVASLNGAQQLRMGQAIDNAAHSLDIIDDLAKQWDAGRFPPLNRAQLALATNGAMGPKAQTLATQLQGQIADVTSELANVYMGGNSPTDHALSLAAKNLSADWSRQQLQGMVEQSRKNLQIRANSMRNVGVSGASPNNPYAPQGEVTGAGQTITPPAATTTAKEGERRNIKGGGVAEYRGGKWIRIQN